MADTMLTRPTTVVEQILPTPLRGRVPVVLLAVAGAALAAWGASTVDAPIASDYGLVAVLPATFWVGLAVLNVAIGLQLARPVVRRLDMALTLGLLVVVLYGAAAFATGTPRTEVAWRHLGIMRALLGTGTVDPLIDGYFNWPGFFAGLGALLQVTHVPPVTLALLAPVAERAAVDPGRLPRGPVADPAAAPHLARGLAVHAVQLDRPGLPLAAGLRLLHLPRGRRAAAAHARRPARRDPAPCRLRARRPGGLVDLVDLAHPGRARPAAPGRGSVGRRAALGRHPGQPPAHPVLPARGGGAAHRHRPVLDPAAAPGAGRADRDLADHRRLRLPRRPPRAVRAERPRGDLRDGAGPAPGNRRSPARDRRALRHDAGRAGARRARHAAPVAGRATGTSARPC